MPIYLSVEGKDPGRTALQAVHTDRLPGPPDGIQQWGAVTLIHDAGQAGPLHGLSLNQTLPGVKLVFARTGHYGREKIYYSVNLTPAKVVSINPESGGSDRGVTFEYEKIDFKYQKILVNWKNGATIRKEEWA